MRLADKFKLKTITGGISRANVVRGGEQEDREKERKRFHSDSKNVSVLIGPLLIISPKSVLVFVFHERWFWQPFENVNVLEVRIRCLM